MPSHTKQTVPMTKAQQRAALAAIRYLMRMRRRLLKARSYGSVGDTRPLLVAEIDMVLEPLVDAFE